MTLCCRRRRPCKSPEQAAVLAPLMASPEALGSLPVAPSDPVEMRRLKFQTPAMMSHPPIHIIDLAAHIDALKTSDNVKFSQEYEVSLITRYCNGIVLCV